jgi:chromosome segregation ATPase
MAKPPQGASPASLLDARLAAAAHQFGSAEAALEHASASTAAATTSTQTDLDSAPDADRFRADAMDELSQLSSGLGAAAGAGKLLAGRVQALFARVADLERKLSTAQRECEAARREGVSRETHAALETQCRRQAAQISELAANLGIAEKKLERAQNAAVEGTEAKRHFEALAEEVAALKASLATATSEFDTLRRNVDEARQVLTDFSDHAARAEADAEGALQMLRGAEKALEPLTQKGVGARKQLGEAASRLEGVMLLLGLLRTDHVAVRELLAGNAAEAPAAASPASAPPAFPAHSPPAT